MLAKLPAADRTQLEKKSTSQAKKRAKPDASAPIAAGVEAATSAPSSPIAGCDSQAAEGLLNKDSNAKALQFYLIGMACCEACVQAIMCHCANFQGPSNDAPVVRRLR